jgi:hypothetical protein
MKKIILLLVTIFITRISFSQTVDTTQPATTYWKKGGMTGLNFTQSSFTNWAAGGENAFSATALTTLFANYKRTNGPGIIQLKWPTDY